MFLELEKKTNNKNSFISNSENVSRNKTSYASNNSPNKNNKSMNIYRFIKEKKKFSLPNIYDKKGMKEFLSSKDAAMEEIKLDDDLLDENEKSKSKLDLIKINLSKNKTNNRGKRKEYLSSKFNTQFKNNFNSDKRIKKGKNSKYSSNIIEVHSNSPEVQQNNNQKENIDNIINEENKKKIAHCNSECFYKFIIKNANQPDDIFYKKFEKQKLRCRKACSSYKLLLLKQKESQKKCQKFSKYSYNKNNFTFSEKAMNQMEKDDLKLSLIVPIDNIKKSERKKDKHNRSVEIKDERIKDDSFLDGIEWEFI